MSFNLQPKGLFEMAFGSFITYMENEARQLMKLDPSPEAVSVTSRVCSELKRFFHGTRLPPSKSNELTKHLLIKLYSMDYMIKSSINTEYCQQMLLSLVEVFMHPDVTAIELGPRYFIRLHLDSIILITWTILTKVCNLHNLKVLNLPAGGFQHCKKHTLIFPFQLQKLTVSGSILEYGEDILRSIVESCPELKGLTMCWADFSDESIPLILQCKHLETLRIPNSYLLTDDVYVTLINGLSTDATSDMLSASTLKSFYSKVGHQNTLNLIIDKLPHLTEIELVCEGNIDLSNLTQLKNLRSLSLEACHNETANEYKKFLPVLGKNLVFLEMKDHDILDFELIAETCTHLKCLHVWFRKCKNIKYSSKTFQNFKTVECLKVGYQEDSKAGFLIAQCTNIKTLTIDMSLKKDDFSCLDTTIENVLRRTPALNWIVIVFSLYEDEFDRHFIDSLPRRHPNFHVVKTLYSMRLSSLPPVFDSFGCYDSF